MSEYIGESVAAMKCPECYSIYPDKVPGQPPQTVMSCICNGREKRTRRVFIVEIETK